MARRDVPKAVALRVLAAFLILWTPFFVFAAYRDYPVPPLSMFYAAAICLAAALLLGLACGRVGRLRQAIVFTGLIAIALDIQFGWFEGTAAYAVSLALLALFWALRHHLSTILAAMFVALLVSTAVFGSLKSYNEVERVERAAAGDGTAGGAGRGLVIHLLLDEHAGIQGLPEDLPGGEELRQRQREFFLANGFRLFGNAISEYEASRNSISGILNFTAGSTPYERYEGKRPFVLKQSSYFEALSQAGYDIRVYQSTYMDYCREFAALIAGCYTYRHDGTDWLKASSLDSFEKLKVFFGLYLQLSGMAESVLKAYVRAGQWLQAHGIRLPGLLEWDSPSSINAMAAFDRIAEEVTTGPDGTAYFAHLLIPHGPYVFDRECRLRGNFSSWMSNRPPYRRDNDEGERALRYRNYFDQVHCMQRRLQSLFDGLKAAGRFDSATIILHGDHGSRIYRTVARAGNIDRLDRQDYLDGFATLFAVKAPALEAGYDAELAPVSRLLARTIGRSDLIAQPDAPIQVYLEGKDDYDPWTAVPWRFTDQSQN